MKNVYGDNNYSRKKPREWVKDCLYIDGTSFLKIDYLKQFISVTVKITQTERHLLTRFWENFFLRELYKVNEGMLLVILKKV